MALAAIAASAVAVWPQARRRIALERAIRHATEGRTAYELVGFREPAAILRLIDELERSDPAEGRCGAPFALRSAIDLLALDDHPDPRPRERLLRLANDATASPRKRLEALYLIDELDHPTLPREPEGFSELSRVRVADGQDGPLEVVCSEVLNAPRLPIDLGSFRRQVISTHEIDDVPWRALLRVAQWLHAKVVTEGDKVRLVTRVPRAPKHWFEEGRPTDEDLSAWLGRRVVIVPPASLENAQAFWAPFADPENTLRAIAAFNGCTVADTGEALEVRRR